MVFSNITRIPSCFSQFAYYSSLLHLYFQLKCNLWVLLLTKLKSLMYIACRFHIRVCLWEYTRQEVIGDWIRTLWSVQVKFCNFSPRLVFKHVTWGLDGELVPVRMDPISISLQETADIWRSSENIISKPTCYNRSCAVSNYVYWMHS